jgi:hypothetical protein
MVHMMIRFSILGIRVVLDGLDSFGIGFCEINVERDHQFNVCVNAA